jgi:hypothetical protein
LHEENILLRIFLIIASLMACIYTIAVKDNDAKYRKKTTVA